MIPCAPSYDCGPKKKKSPAPLRKLSNAPNTVPAGHPSSRQGSMSGQMWSRLSSLSGSVHASIRAENKRAGRGGKKQDVKGKRTTEKTSTNEPLKGTVIGEDEHLGTAHKYAAENVLIDTGDDSSSAVWALPSGKSGGFIIDLGFAVTVGRFHVSMVARSNGCVSATDEFQTRGRDTIIRLPAGPLCLKICKHPALHPFPSPPPEHTCTHTHTN